jgi:hypothetical protein
MHLLQKGQKNNENFLITVSNFKGALITPATFRLGFGQKPPQPQQKPARAAQQQEPELEY